MAKPETIALVPVGDVVIEEMVARGWSLYDAAERSGLDTARVRAILGGVTALTEEDAAGLARAFGVSAAFWMNFDRAYRGAQPPGRITVENARSHA